MAHHPVSYLEGNGGCLWVYRNWGIKLTLLTPVLRFTMYRALFSALLEGKVLN
jgi:hypothetical protein